jgi:hypothetical protein
LLVMEIVGRIRQISEARYLNESESERGERRERSGKGERGNCKGKQAGGRTIGTGFLVRTEQRRAEWNEQNKNKKELALNPR